VFVAVEGHKLELKLHKRSWSKDRHTESEVAAILRFVARLDADASFGVLAAASDTEMRDASRGDSKTADQMQKRAFVPFSRAHGLTAQSVFEAVRELDLSEAKAARDRDLKCLDELARRLELIRAKLREL
jgi:hypothetical protein